MHYQCLKCGCNRFEYTTHTHPCPICGNTILQFEHIGFFGHPNHWITIDVSTGKTISTDLCDVPPNQTNYY